MQLGSVSGTELVIDDAVVFFERHWRYFETADQQIDHPTRSRADGRSTRLICLTACCANSM